MEIKKVQVLVTESFKTINKTNRTNIKNIFTSRYPCSNSLKEMLKFAQMTLKLGTRSATTV